MDILEQKIRADLAEADEKVVELDVNIFSKNGLFKKHLVTKKLISNNPHRDLHFLTYLMSINPVRVQLTMTQLINETGLDRRIGIRALRSLVKSKYVTIAKQGRDGQGWVWDIIINPQVTTAFNKFNTFKVPYVYLDNKLLDKMLFTAANLFILIWNIKKEDGSFEYRTYNSVFSDCFDPRTHRKAFKELVKFNLIIEDENVPNGTFKGTIVNPIYWGNKSKMEKDEATNKFRETLIKAAQIYKSNPWALDQVAHEKRIAIWNDLMSEDFKSMYHNFFTTQTAEQYYIMMYPYWFAACKKAGLIPDTHPVMEMLDRIKINGLENIPQLEIKLMGEELLKPNALNMTAEEAGEFIGRQLKNKTNISRVELARMIDEMDFTTVDINLNRRNAGIKVTKAAAPRSPGKFKPTEAAKWDMDLLKKEKEAHEAKVAEYKLIKAASKKVKN